MTGTFSHGMVRSIDANRSVKDVLSAAIGSSRSRSRISVTDLVNPMQSFHNRTYPKIRPSPDRLQIMMAGTGFHEIFGQIVSSEEYLEQLLEMDGVVGKVDIYEDIPVEIKTTSSIPTDIYKGRSSYFEQLGMYCVMAGKEKGRLFVYQRHKKELPAELKVYEAIFTNVRRIKEEMLSRRDLFQKALEHKDSSRLPQCEWIYRGCDYLSVCPCRFRVPAQAVVPSDEVRIQEMPDLAKELKAQLVSRPVPHSDLCLKDLVFPRKTALRLKRIAGKHSEDFNPRRMQELEWKGFKFALHTAMRQGTVGQFNSTTVRLDSMVDKVDLFENIPTILRISNMKTMVRREMLTRFFPDYFDRLAFQCALTNIRKGRLILYYEEIPNDKFMVYDVIFHSRDAILHEIKLRLELLEGNAPYTSFPKCPPGIFQYCDFAPACDCGEGVDVFEDRPGFDKY